MEMLLRSRVDKEEIMDGSDFHEGEYEQTLRELEWINRLTFGYRPTLDAVERAISLSGNPRLRILDIGFGYGDTLREIRRWGMKRGYPLTLHGIELNPSAKKWAESATPSDYEIRYSTGDVLALEHAGYDLVIASLMMHHLRDEEIVRMLQWMTRNARVAWFVNDLHRHPLAYHFARIASRIGGFSRMVQNDAPLSVARSFNREDWKAYLSRAKIPVDSVGLRWHWAFRYGVFCHTPLAQVSH